MLRNLNKLTRKNADAFGVLRPVFIVDIYTQIGTVGGGESYDHCSTGAHLHLTVMKGWSGSTYYDPSNYFDIKNQVGFRFSSRW